MQGGNGTASAPRDWLSWAVDVGLLPNKQERLILLLIGLLGLAGLVVYHNFSKEWYTQRIKAALQQEAISERKAKLEGPTHELTPDEIAKLNAELGLPPEAEISDATLAARATALAQEDFNESWQGPSRTAKGHEASSPGVRKFIQTAGRTSLATVATAAAVPASVGGGLVGGAMGVPKGPSGVVSGFVLGATSGGATVFRGLGLSGKKKKGE